MSRTIKIQTPGRLHFGLSSFGGVGRQFSGLGMMLDGAGVTLQVSSADSFEVEGPHHKRAQDFALAFAAHRQLPSPPTCHIKILSAPPDHVGLGVGTQLGLAVAAGLAEYFKIPWRDADLLSQMSGRGKRSAIGTYGFLHGGLLVDAGKLPDEPLGKISARETVPPDWRLVLIRHPATCGLAGERETQAIASLPPVPAEVTRHLQQLIDTQILPAVRDADWQGFSEGIYLYGYRAGECFAAAQGGPFASPEIAELIETVRKLGIPGVGQSSWGPTVFAIAKDESSAKALVGQLGQHADIQHCHIAICQANNSGATVHIES
ncbi:MAG: beta-RFAP synthase [Planctomycetes bacterium]|nr:beta-RFAP synthase [Planctomycetota bacterium]